MSVIDATSGSQGTQLDQLIAAFQAAERPKVDAISQRKTALEQKQTFYNRFYNRLNTLISQIDIFTASGAGEKFVTRKATVSDAAVLSVTANKDAFVGSNSVFVERLAKNDVLISDRVVLANNYSGLQGDKSFSIIVNGETVTYTLTGLTGEETNEDIMNKIVQQINSNSDSKVVSSFIKDTPATGRMTFTSKETGADNYITFSDTDKVLFPFGIKEALFAGNNRRLSGETSAGYRTGDSSLLDSKIVVNSISVYRGSNTIDDALPGLTLNLLKTQEAGEEVAITTEVGTDSVVALIEPFLKTYNELLTFVRSDRTMLRSEPSLNSFANNLRGLSTQPISGLAEGEPVYLTEIGIKINSDGTLTISDQTKLADFLKDDPQKVANLFTAHDSFAKRLGAMVEAYRGDAGVVKARTLSLGREIDAVQKKKEQVQQRIDKQSEALRKEYMTLMKILYESQAQYQLFTSYTSSGSTNASSQYF